MISKSLLALCALLLLSNAAAYAVPIYAVDTEDRLISFDSASPSVLTSAKVIKNGSGHALTPDESVLAIDFRHSDASRVPRRIWALLKNGRLVGIDVDTATIVNTLPSPPLDLDGTSFGMDIDPVSESFWVVSNLDQLFNVRRNGSETDEWEPLRYAESGHDPNIVGVAFDNNVPNYRFRTPFMIDSALDILATHQFPFQEGTVRAVGSLGIDASEMVGFDIYSVQLDSSDPVDTAYAAIAVAGKSYSELYTINLLTGQATLVGPIGKYQRGAYIKALTVAVFSAATT